MKKCFSLKYKGGCAMDKSTDRFTASQLLERGGERLNTSELLASFFSNYSTLLIVIVLAVAFGLAAPNFLLMQNIINIFKQVSVVAIMAIGMTMVILLGGIDLSVGSSALLSGVVTIFLINHEYMSTGWAIVVGLAAAAIVGFINGFLIEKIEISAIIVTLGTMIAIRGLAQTILWIDNSWLWVKDPLFIYIANKGIGPVPMIVIIMLVLYAAFMVILSQTGFGRRLYAIGGNQRAAELCGIPVRRLKILAYVFCGLTGGIGGLVLISRLSAVSPAVGNNIQFDVITAVILGGASLSGGSGKLEKTLLGALIVGMILNFLTIKGIQGTYQSAVNGFIILIAAILDRLSKAKTAA
jgi:ribose transport system permease protein